MENFKKRNEKIKIENKIKYNKLNTDEEIRHENNLLKLNEENEKLLKSFVLFIGYERIKFLNILKKEKN